MRHVNSRWLCLNKVLTRILEQWNNMQEYFLKFLPKQKNFANDVGKTSRYNRIKQILEKNNTRIHLNFAVHVAQLLEKFLIPFQSSDPLIHALYPAFGELFFNIMSKFLNIELLKTNTNKRKSAYELGNLKISNSIKSIHEIDYGTKTAHLIAQEETKKNLDTIKMEFKSAYVELVSYLQAKLPHQSSFLADVQYFDPRKITFPKAVNAIGRIALKIANALKNTQFTNLKPEEYVDSVKYEFKLLQTEDLNDKFKSYKIDEFWFNIGEILDSFNIKKFHNLSKLALSVLSFSHGNAIPERGFSHNKHLLSSRESFQEETIESIRLIKDHIKLIGNVDEFPISRQ